MYIIILETCGIVKTLFCLLLFYLTKPYLYHQQIILQFNNLLVRIVRGFLLGTKPDLPETLLSIITRR
jgi:hypothetical protein